MFESKYHVRAFILTVLLWHGLSWFGTTEVGPSDADFRLFDLSMLGIHTAQVFVILLIYKIFSASADEKQWEAEKVAMQDYERRSKEWLLKREQQKQESTKTDAD